jgi:octopine/nopaline transport system permease protein
MLELLALGDEGWGDELLHGALMTLALAIPSFVAGCLIGTLAAAWREGGGRIANVIVFGYTTFVRGIPELVVIYLIFFGGGQLLRLVLATFGYHGEYNPSAYFSGLGALALICGAYATEVMRGSFKAVDKGQVEAARAFGWSRSGTFARIIAPQLFRIALPSLGNVWLLTLKDTALISVTGLIELMRAAGIATGSTALPLYFYSAALILYLVMSAGSNAVFDRLEHRSRRGFPQMGTP